MKTKIMDEITYKPIGIIHSPFKTIENMPIQHTSAKGENGEIEIFPEYAEGLKDLEGFSHIILLCHLHKVDHVKLLVVPFLDTVLRGVFATRAPVRPNPIGLTVVKLIEVKGNIITVENIDFIDKTPLLDIKPCLPMIDDLQEIKLGWLTGKIEKFSTEKSDKRFK
ncbi:MAG TPA: tRNA (N6-threonylcarbamoyladenosine(37)-N6)-methyltransferase TrmO [Bacteroidales bacterium]|nr:tRNA (N6-threonylcarbamoyladenosine(37)-N6)-methyltransferase TrmO [Bacteroidales bacterium]HPI29939.1 tRNA (N6-threonylcarbamoyladenosine(37)-N6)-methyltransferase TrmO [Bacteroidales bacterium]HQN16022.1 tRNA (N6-threonylcarbamoyladenosine(37)-N6)-methyltransferase TrmO [Bacteroidales bacterium]HQP15640.1 tRNA (N6-threonylcarbamoyladenosine(37)-N6)-methyltransferase TrmO [Bacteroidales bacterium]